MEHEYEFDLDLRMSIKVKANNKEEAQELLESAILDWNGNIVNDIIDVESTVDDSFIKYICTNNPKGK